MCRPDYTKHIFSDQLSAEQKEMVGNSSHWDMIKSLSIVHL